MSCLCFPALELRVGSVLIGFQHVRRVLLVAAPQLVQQLQAEDEQARLLILPLPLSLADAA